MKLSTEKVKAQKVSKFSKSFKILTILGVVVIAIIGFNIWSSLSLRDTVSIVRLKSAVPQDGVVSQDNMVEGKMLRSDYEAQGVYTLSDGTKRRSIVLWEDRTRITNAYAAYYIRQDTPLYWDSLSKETPKKYAYLYKMDGELLKINVDANEFGTMLVPGDKINVRASYTDRVYTLPSEKEFLMQQQTGIQPQTTVDKTILLFNSVSVLDILNSNGESIFDIYYRLLALPKSKQTEIAATEAFKTSVRPVHILLNVTPEEALRYMSVQKKGASYVMTLLPRTSGNPITEVLNSLQVGLQRTQ